LARQKNVPFPNGSWDFQGEPGAPCTYAPAPDPQPQSDQDKLDKRATTFGTEAMSLSSLKDQQVFNSDLGKTYGLAIMAGLADMLSRLGLTGTLDDPPPPSFSKGPETLEQIYAVQSDGTMLQFTDHTLYYDLPVDNILGVGPTNLHDALQSGTIDRSAIGA